jgi:hypothetical protein
MIHFTLCEHYDNNNTFEIDSECFICFEFKNDNGSIPIKLNSQSLYLNQCVCNGPVHNECLQVWFNKNKTCPICRIKVIENNTATVIIYNYIPLGGIIYAYIKKITLTLSRIFLFFVFLFVFIDFYFVVIKSKYRQYNDYTRMPIPIPTPILDYEDIE